MTSIIEINNLHKSFNGFEVLKGINLTINQACVYGILGPNGAGKTTIIRCLLKILKPNEGGIFFKQKELIEKDIHKFFGYLPEFFFPPKQVSPLDLLSVSGKTKIEIENILSYVGLAKVKNKKIKEFSRGMVQRLGLAFITIDEPDIIILDEPTQGLDPLGQRKITDLIKNLKAKGKTVFICSHSLAQMEKLVDKIGIIEEGQMRYEGTVKDLIEKYECQSLEEAFLKELKNEKNI